MRHSSILNSDVTPDRLAGMTAAIVKTERLAHVRARGDDHDACAMRTRQTENATTTTVAAWVDCKDLVTARKELARPVPPRQGVWA